MIDDKQGLNSNIQIKRKKMCANMDKQIISKIKYEASILDIPLYKFIENIFEHYQESVLK